MQAIFKASPSATVILLPDSPQFTISEVNRAYLLATGMNADKLLGKGLFEAFPENPHDPDADGETGVRASLEQVLATGAPHTTEVQRYDIPVRGGSKFEEKYWRSENIPVLNKKGKIDFIIHSVTDVTARVLSEKKAKLVTHELLETEEHYRSLFEHNPDAVFSFDLEGTFLSANKAAAELTETSVEELLNITFMPFVADEDKQQVTTYFQQAIQGKIQNYDCDIVTANGNRRTLKVTNMPILVNDKIVGIYGIAKDITEEKEAEQLLDKAYQLARIGTWEFDMQTHELYWSHVTKQVHGFGPDYQPDLESTIALFKEGINRETFARAAKAAIEQEKPFDVELKIVSGQGDERWIRATGEPEYEDGVCTRFYGISQNVTDRRKAEEDLQLSEQRFKALVQDGSDLIAILDAGANYTYVAPTFEAILGIPAEDFIGTNAIDYIHDDDKERIIKILTGLPGNRCTQISPFRFRDSENNWRWIETTITNMMDDPAVKGFVANSRDVTEKVEGETRLKESLERYEIVSQATSDTIWDLDLEKDEMQYNRNIYTMFGYKKSEVKEPGEWWRNNIHPDNLQEVINTLDRAMEKQLNRFQLEYRFRCADGSYKHVYDRAFLVYDDNNTPVRMTGAMQDVTSQKEEEEQLRLLESVITNSTESVLITEAKPEDPMDRKILYVNKAFTDMTGYAREEVIGKPLYFLSDPEIGTDVQRLKLREAMQLGNPIEIEFIDYKKDGGKYWIHISALPVEDQKGEYSHWITIGRDVTERRRHEEEIGKSLKEKDTLLAEIHHRVKNNLAVISGLLQLQRFKTKNEKLTSLLMESEMRIKSMALVHEKLYQLESLSAIRFDEYMEELIVSIKQTLDTENKVSYHTCCDNIQLNINQAVPCALIINELLTNAFKHAFSDTEGGQIGVDVKMSEPTGDVTITIKDDGKGLPGDFDARMEESLGFTIIHTLLNQLGADHEVTSPGGTCVSFSFKMEDVRGSSSALNPHKG